MKQRIETVPYNKGFVLACYPDHRENYMLVNGRDREVSKVQPIPIKDTHGNVTKVPWGTEVILLENLTPEIDLWSKKS